jgi:hypothetical protein
VGLETCTSPLGALKAITGEVFTDCYLARTGADWADSVLAAQEVIELAAGCEPGWSAPVFV